MKVLIYIYKRRFVAWAGAGMQSLIGGSVVVLSEEDGAIADIYIYYCEQPNGTIDWSQFD